MPTAETQPLVKSVNPAEWGSIQDVVNAPLIDVPADASWLSVAGMWLTLPISLIQGVIGGLCSSVFVCMSIGTCCIPCSEQLCSAMGSVMQGHPCYLAWTWWRYVIGGLVALIANGKSRLALFTWEWKSFGSAAYWWHGEGIWMWSYKDCDRILKSQQVRKSAFGCVTACIPDLFATNVLIFLSNDGPNSDWAAVRAALHNMFLNPEGLAYRERISKLQSLVSNDWKDPKFDQLNDKTLLQRSVVKCIMFVMFGEWLDDADADTLAGWRTEASAFILPRLVQRFAFNLLINKVKKLRIDTVGIIVKLNLQQAFIDMNNSLPSRWQRSHVVKLCDEIMYVIGFAGIGGTSAAVESVASFLQVKSGEAPTKSIDFGDYNTADKMKAAFAQDPDAYIRETCRLDPPVTSATGVLKEVTEVSLAGRDFTFDPGLLNQYVLSMANRDPALFSSPEKFDPGRINLHRALTWNGAFGAADEADYPRICPGRYLSLDVTKVIINHVLGTSAPLNQYFGDGVPPRGCC